MLKYRSLIGAIVLTQTLFIGNAWADPFSTTSSHFEHPNFSTTMGSLQVSQLSTSLPSLQTHMVLPENRLSTSHLSDLGSTTPQFTTTQFESIAGNENAQFSIENSRFSNMRMEFSNPEFNHLNFNVK